MATRGMLYEGDGLLHTPVVLPTTRHTTIERSARQLHAPTCGNLLERLGDWLEASAREAWRRRTERYLAQASDLADLERRMRELERSGELFR